MKLREWEDKQGMSYRSALRWFHGGTLPVEAEQMASGAIIVKLEPVLGDQKAALYARVSSSDQKTNLDSQLVRLTHFAVENKLSIAAVSYGTQLSGAMEEKADKRAKGSRAVGKVIERVICP